MPIPPPVPQPDDMSEHVVRINSRAEKLSVCSGCRKRDVTLQIPMLDPIPPEVLAVDACFWHYNSALTLWVKRDFGPGFAKVIGTTSCVSRAINLNIRPPRFKRHVFFASIFTNCWRKSSFVPVLQSLGCT
jgi:hypothetical protein